MLKSYPNYRFSSAKELEKYIILVDFPICTLNYYK